MIFTQKNYKMKAINPKNQAKLNKAIYWLKRCNELNDLRNFADDNGDQKSFYKLDDLCAKAFDKYLDYCGELPKNQVKAIEKSELY